MKRFVVAHREIGEPEGHVGLFYIDAQDQSTAELIFHEAHEDLPYFIVFVKEVNPEGVLYWIYFTETNLFGNNQKQKMGLRVPENTSVYSAFDKYWDGWNLRIESYEIAPGWLQ